MKTILAALVLGLSLAAQAQVLLSLDFNDRSFNDPTNTAAGFDAFVIGSVVSSTAKQTNATVRTFGNYTVTLSGLGNDPGYDDRLRTGTQAPTNQLDFTDERLLRDFVFSPAGAGGGLDVVVDGLFPDEVYRISFWCYDTQNAGFRPSDWYVNGSLVRDNFVFNGGVYPTNNDQAKFSVTVPASPTGRLLIQGRRDAASGGVSVILNALQIEFGLREPPAIVTAPQNMEIFAGDRAAFTVGVTGTAPLSFQWRKDGQDLPGQTNISLVLSNTTVADAGEYELFVTNEAGSVSSPEAVLAVRPVTSLTNGLLAYWPLDVLGGVTPDLSGNEQPLEPLNVTEEDVVSSQRGNAIRFNGASALLARTNVGNALPASAYSSYTVALWVRGNYTGQNDRRVYAEGSTTNNSPLFSIGTHSGASSNVVDIFIRNTDGGTPINHRRSTLPAFDDQWHHIAWVDDLGWPTLYVDGVADTNNFNYVHGLITTDTSAIGGLQRATNSSWFAGLIDDVACWRRALTATEVQQVMDGALVVTGDAPPSLTQIEETGANMLVLRFTAPAPAAFRIEASPTLTPTAWTTVNDAVIEQDGVNFTATFPKPDAPQQFYRVAR